MNKFQFSNGEVEIVNIPQSVYDDFNNFIFAAETRVFQSSQPECIFTIKLKRYQEIL